MWKHTRACARTHTHSQLIIFLQHGASDLSTIAALSIDLAMCSNPCPLSSTSNVNHPFKLKVNKQALSYGKNYKY